MKQTISSLAKFADEVGKDKFRKLSSKKQHELLGALACAFFEKKDYNQFLKRYNTLHEWAELDRFSPPQWLTDQEKLKGYKEFHFSFSPNPPDQKSGQDFQLKNRDCFDLTIYLDQVRSPYNIGSVLRIADNFKVKEVVHSSDFIDIENSKLKKASMGTHRWIPLRYEKDPVNWLKNSDKTVAGLEKTANSIPIHDFNFEKRPLIIVAGNEENGISENILSCCDIVIEIPMFGFKKSMNVNNALSIICFKYCEKYQK